MPLVSIKNSTNQTIHIFQYVESKYQIGDFISGTAITIANLADGLGELKAVVEEVDALPEQLKTIRDFFKYLKVIYKIRKKTIKVKGDSEKAVNDAKKAYNNFFTKTTIPVSPGETKNIFTESTLKFYFSLEGIAQLLGANVITIGVTSDNGLLSLQYQSAVNTEWEVTQSGVQSCEDSSIRYRWHGQGEHLPIPLKWRPAMVNFEEQIYLVARGENHSVWWSAYDGDSWSFPIHIHGIRTKEGVSMAVWNGKIYAAWIPVPVNWESPRINAFDGESWSYIKGPPYSAPHPPAIVANDNGKLEIALTYNNKTTGNQIYISYLDKEGWPEAMYLFGKYQSSNQPSMLLIKEMGQMFSAWRGLDAKDDDSIYFTFSGQISIQPQAIKGAGTSNTPAFAYILLEDSKDILIYCAWKKPGTNSGISFSSLRLNIDKYIGPDTIIKWDSQHQDVPNARTDNAPSLVSFNGSIFLAWKDVEISHVVNWSQLKDGEWSSPDYII